MSADIVKEAVFDDRIVQSRPRYAVEKGALSLTNAPFNAIAATASQMTFNIYVPSENVYVDRALRWSAEARFQLTATVANANQLANMATDAVSAGANTAIPYVVIGKDLSLAPLPLNALCQTMTATINDTTSVINSQDVLYEVMRLTDYKKNLKQRTCPTMLDKYQANRVASGSINDPRTGFGENMNVDEMPNGAYGGLRFTDQNGNVLVGTGSYTYNQQVIWYQNGVPVISQITPVPGGGAAPFVNDVPIFVSFFSTELLTLSPFVFADDCEHDTGLFGINNIQLIMNFKSGVPLSRVFRTLGDTLSGGANYANITAIDWNYNATQGVWANAVMNCQFLTPSLDVPLPPKSVVPYMEFPRYITQSQNGPLTAYGTQGSVGQLQSQTITLPQIPDLLIIYVKPTQVQGSPDPTDPRYGDSYLPVATNATAGVKNPLSINFDNFSGLLSSHTAEELYQMSVANGLEMTYPVWSGLVRDSSTIPATTVVGNVATEPAYIAGSLRPSVGGFLVLKPSKDITLQSGQAPSLVGNFTLQFNLQVVNTFPFPVQPVLYVITANSGFFESIRGSSRIIKGVLSEQDIISAPVAGTESGLHRLVGGRISFGSLANAFSKAKEIYEKTKPLVSEAKKLLPEGKVKDVMGSVGYGTGAGTGAGKRRGLSARLM